MLQSQAVNKATTSHLKKHNETLLLKEIYAHRAVSRVELAHLTRLSRPSVTELTQNLIKRGLVLEMGQDQLSEKVGKKPTLLAFNADIYQMITVAVNDTIITGALLDLRMNVIDEQFVPMNGAKSTQVVNLLIDLISSIAEKATRPLLGIVIGTPGIIDSDSGIVHLASNLGWKDLPLVSLISRHFQLPIYINNDSNMLAIGEYRFGLAREVRDLVVVKIGVGIGAGLVADGRLIEGSTYGAGDLGHTPYPSLNNICICGRRGCLETISSWWSLKQGAQEIIERTPNSLLSKMMNGGEPTIEMMAQALKAHDPDVTALVHQAATYLSYALLTTLHLLNPHMIILTGSMVRLGDIFLDQVRHMVQSWAFPYMTKDVTILANAQDDRSMLLGAGALLLEKELGL